MTRTMKALERELATLRKRAERLEQKERAGVVGRIKVAIKHYDLTADELGFGGLKTKRAPKVAVKKPASKKAALKKPKYRDEAGNTWVGRGKRPAWLHAALDAGRTLEEFAV